VRSARLEARVRILAAATAPGSWRPPAGLRYIFIVSQVSVERDPALEPGAVRSEIFRADGSSRALLELFHPNRQGR